VSNALKAENISYRLANPYGAVVRFWLPFDLLLYSREAVMTINERKTGDVTVLDVDGKILLGRG
jgi:hypothetical protein